jgi:hypothetical protein
MSRRRFNAADDSLKSWELGIAAARERCIRRKQIQPRPGDAEEQRWAREGDVPPSRLDTVRGAK